MLATLRDERTFMSTRGRLRAVLVILALVIGVVSPAGLPGAVAAVQSDVTQPAQPASGPGGRDYRFHAVERRYVGEAPAGAYVFTPAGAKEDLAQLPLVIFVHGFSAVDPALYGGWIEHLVRRGAIVVYPEYQAVSPLVGAPGAYLGDMMAGIREGLLTLTLRDDASVVVVGHSLGGSLAVNYAALAGGAGFPEPDVLMAVEPGGCRNCGSDTGIGVALPTASVFPKDLSVSVVVGNDDTLVGEAAARTIWGLMAEKAAQQKAYVRIMTDRHGTPPLVADHQIPLTRSPGTLNALDWNGTWRLLDLQMMCAEGDAPCDSVFGSDEVGPMGVWSDGQPVRALELEAPPER